MRLNVSAWSIRKPIPSVVLFIVLIVLGVFSFRQLPITRFPNIDIPIVAITVTQSGAAPSELQNQVTKRVEDAVAGVNGVKHIISNISEGLSTTTIEFRLEINSDRAVNDVKDAIAKIRADLPRTIDEPIVQRVEIAGLPIVTYAASDPAMTPEELSWFVDDVVARAAPEHRRGRRRHPRRRRRPRDPRRAQCRPPSRPRHHRRGRQPAASPDQRRSRRRPRRGRRPRAVDPDARQRADPRDARRHQHQPARRTASVRLDELATVTDSAAEPRTYARFNGEPVVAFAVSRATGASDATVGAAVAAKVKQIGAEHPGIHFAAIDNSVVYTVGNYKSAMHTLIEGAVLAVLVVFIFLKDWRATLITSLALPLSVFPTFWAMGAMGFSLNLVSLLAITLVTGILVDDAIVEIENIVRHMRMGKSAYRAALEAADEIGLAVIAITFTIVAVFAPVSFMGGIAGQYFKQFGLTVAAAVLISLLVARLITPMLAAYFMRPHKHVEERDGFIMRFYTRLVGWSVRHRFVTFVLGLLLLFRLDLVDEPAPVGFLPEEDISRSLFVMELPPGARLDDTEAETDARDRASARNAGGALRLRQRRPQLPAKKEVRQATLTVNFAPKEERDARQKASSRTDQRPLARDPRRALLAAQRERPARPLADRRRTRSGRRRRDRSEARARDARGSRPSKASSRRSRSTGPRSASGRSRRSPPSSASRPTSSPRPCASATIGDIGANLAKFDAGDRQVPIRVQLPESARADRGIIDVLKVPAKNGAAVPLSAVADVEFGQGPTSIDRYDRALRVALEGDMRGTDALGEVIEAVMKLPTAQNLPAGVSIRQTGDAEVMEEVFAGFGKAMGAGIMMVLGVLILLFASFLQPFTILLSLPLSIGGAILALLITQRRSACRW